MSEFRQSRSKPPADLIAEGFDNWLSSEITNSGINQNAGLDDVSKFIQTSTAKTFSHFDRYRLLTESFENSEPTDDAVAYQIYGVQAALSGAYRTQCFLTSHDQEDYFRKRQNKSLGIDIYQSTSDHLVDRFGQIMTYEDLKKPVVSKQELVDASNDANQLRLDTNERFHHDDMRKIGMRKLHHLIRFQRLQSDWLKLGIDYVLFSAASKDGDLGQVPIREPKPITHSKIEYPFKKLLQLAPVLGDFGVDGEFDG